MKDIFINEWNMFLRTRMIIYTSIFFICSLIIAIILGNSETKQKQQQQALIQQQLRKQWEELDSINTHRVAHFGSFALKPPSILSSIDEGVNGVVGNVVRLEAHVQNEIAYSDVSQSMMVSKFGKLKSALLLQYIIPVFLIFIAFSSVSYEKENGRIKLLVIQNASMRKIIFAKTLSIWIYSILLLSATILFSVIFTAQNISYDSIIRMCILFVMYSLYYYIISLITTWLSALFKDKTFALSSMIALWFLWTIFLPKIWGTTSEKIYPMPSRQDFHQAMNTDRASGLDGHNPSDTRAQELTRKTLAHYKVETIEELPINYDGILMQADEEYGNKVWDKHFGANNTILQKQKYFYQLSGIINPFVSIQSVSMGLCGSDNYHHADFLQQAENYRRYFIQALNEKQTFGGSKTDDWSWKEGNEFYRTIKDFQYKPLYFEKVSSRYRIDFFMLGLWTFIITCIVFINTPKIKIT